MSNINVYALPVQGNLIPPASASTLHSPCIIIKRKYLNDIVHTCTCMYMYIHVHCIHVHVYEQVYTLYVLTCIYTCTWAVHNITIHVHTQNILLSLFSIDLHLC